MYLLNIKKKWEEFQSLKCKIHFYATQSWPDCAMYKLPKPTYEMHCSCLVFLLTATLHVIAIVIHLISLSCSETFYACSLHLSFFALKMGDWMIFCLETLSFYFFLNAFSHWIKLVIKTAVSCWHFRPMKMIYSSEHKHKS